MSPAFGQEEAPTQSPEAQAAFDTALDAHDSGDMAAAAASYRRAVAADPNMTVAHNNLGMVLIQQELLSEAVSALQQAVKVAPDYAEAYNNLGFAYRRMGRDLEAAEHYEKFLALTPDVEDASRIREWIATARAEAAPPAGEVSVVEEVVPPAGGEVPTLSEAPPAGQADVPVAAEAPAAPEGSPPSEGGEGFSDFFKSDLSSLTGSPEAGTESPPAPAEAVPEAPPEPAAPAGDESGLSDKAQAEFDEMFGGDGLGAPAEGGGAATEAPPEDPEVGRLYTEAMTKFQDGDMGEAARFCSLALESAPTHFPTLLLAGRVALGRQDFSRAATMLQKAAEARSDDPEVYYFLGQCYEKRGLLDEAQGAYKKCLEVSPEGPRAKRLANWLEKRSDEGQVAVGMARCELCLRAVKEQETSVHQGRKVCKSCLETLGPEKPADKSRDDEDKRAEKRSIKRSGMGGGKVLVVLLLFVLLGGGGYVALGYFDLAPLPAQLAKLLGKKPKKPVVKRNPVVVKNGTGTNHVKPPNGQTPTTKKVEPKEVSFGTVTEPVLRPLEKLELVLPLKVVWPGEKTAPPENPEPLRFELLTKPEGMLLDEASGRLTWTPGKDGGLKVPSEHEVMIKVTCGKKSAKGKTRIKVKYPLGTAREQDMRLPGAYRASVLGLAFADFDGDGQPDLAASSGGPLSGRLSVLPTGRSAAVDSAAPNWELPGAPVGAAAADLDGDGRADLAWAEWISGRLHLLRGSAGRLAAKPVRAGRAPGPIEALALADLDGDRRAEFVTASRRNGKLFVHRAKGAQLASAKLPPGGMPAVLFALGAVPGRRGQRLGLVASGGSKTGKLFVYSLRKGKLVADQQLDIPAGLVLAARSGDFNADGKLDVALLFGGRTGAITVLNGAEAGKLAQQARPLAVGSLPLGMDAGDINGDGKTDLVVAGPGVLNIYLSAGRGRFLHAGRSRLLGLAGPVVLWGSRKGRPARVAALSLKGRAWVLKLPAPPKPRPPAPPPPPETEKKKAGEKEAGS